MMRFMQRSRQRSGQRGVALITAILLVAIATTLAAKIAWDNQLNMRRTVSTLDQEQARHFALGAEAVAIDILREDDRAFDNADDDWAQLIPALDIGIEETVFGQMQGRLFDAQGKLNVNNLVQGGVKNQVVADQFSSLLRDLRLEPSLVDTLADWIDSDTNTEPAGAEDGSYTGLQPPYRPANNYLLDVSELRAINGFDQATYEALLPHVTALPPGWCGNTGSGTAVNANFASAEVLAALSGVGVGTAESLLQQRGETPWESVDNIGLPPDADLTQVAVTTNCFELRVAVNIGSTTLTMYSLLDRSANNGSIVTRVRAFGLDN